MQPGEKVFVDYPKEQSPFVLFICFYDVAEYLYRPNTYIQIYFYEPLIDEGLQIQSGFPPSSTGGIVGYIAHLADPDVSTMVNPFKFVLVTVTGKRGEPEAGMGDDLKWSIGVCKSGRSRDGDEFFATRFHVFGTPPNFFDQEK